MDTSEKTENDGLLISTPKSEEEIEPAEAEVIMSEISVRTKEYVPQTLQENLDDRASKSQAETDKIARHILVGCLVLIGLSHIVQLIAGWCSSPVFSDGANATLDTIKYVATVIMGYLFGKNALGSKSK